MRGIISRLVPLSVVLLLATSCGDSGTGTTPTTPSTSTETTETFSGILTTNGAFAHPFVVLAGGAITATLGVLSPDSGKPIGMALGTWNGTSCQIVLGNATAVQGSQVLGAATVAGSFCLWVNDAAGTVTSPESYTVQVTHP